MASSQSTVDFILDQIADAGIVRAKKMFGEYGIYCDEKIVAFLCDNQLYLKPTLAAKQFIGDFIEGIPYPGAKPYLLIPGDMWEDPEWLSQLIKLSAKELPFPNVKNK